MASTLITTIDGHQLSGPPLQTSAWLKWFKARSTSFAELLQRHCPALLLLESLSKLWCAWTSAVYVDDRSGGKLLNSVDGQRAIALRSPTHHTWFSTVASCALLPEMVLGIKPQSSSVLLDSELPSKLYVKVSPFFTQIPPRHSQGQRWQWIWEHAGANAFLCVTDAASFLLNETSVVFTIRTLLCLTT